LSSTAAQIGAALARLRGAGELLRQRSAGDVVAALGAVLETIRDRGSSARKTLEAELPDATGFTAGTVRAGLDLALAGWDRSAVRALVEEELGAPGLDRGRLVGGFDTTAVILGGALPTPTLVALLAPLLLRSPVLAKTSQHDPVTARVFARALAEADPGLGACVEVVGFGGDDTAARDALLAAPCVVATGSDETIASLASEVRPPRRFVGYGHRVSLAALGPEALAGDALADAARGLALDVALWDQLGCLSPVAIFVLGDPDLVADALADELEALARSLPRGRVPAEASARIATERSEAEMRAAAGRRVRLRGDAHGAFTVVREADARLRASPLYRFVRVHPVSEPDELLSALGPVGPHLAGVAMAGFGGATRQMAEALGALGASRICRPGRLQAPPLAWRHDGQPLLVPLARFADLELD
jgi:hypothetical protein